MIHQPKQSQFSFTENKSKGYVLTVLIFFITSILVTAFFVPRVTTNLTHIDAPKDVISADVEKGIDISGSVTDDTTLLEERENFVTHVTVPKTVKGIYMSSWVAGTPSIRSKIIKQIENTEANAVIIDIKDYTGMISFIPNSPYLQQFGCIENRIKDIGPFIKELHSKNIYVIGRVAVFQDPCAVKKIPEDAVKTKDGLSVWKDKKGISWMDVGSKKVWEYNIEIAKNAHEMGFDEINFDYIRYPSDGNMLDISFPVSGTKEKSEVLKSFFEYIDTQLRGGRAIGVQKISATSTAYSMASDPVFDELVESRGLSISTTSASVMDISMDGSLVETVISQMPRIIVSADLFGMVTNNKDDLGIGQILEKTAPYVDFIGPMVYPSHYPNNFIGIKNPATEPYKVVKYAMAGGVAKLRNVGLNPLKLRPWLQDFNLGATYTPEMIRAQIQATYDVGLTGWMLWDASNTYTEGGLLRVRDINM